MMQDFTLPWRDETKIITAKRIVGAVAVVESHITVFDLCDSIATCKFPPVSTLTRAYFALLRYAGFNVTDTDVYEWLLSDGANLQNVTECLNTLMELMIPESVRKGGGDSSKPPLEE